MSESMDAATLEQIQQGFRDSGDEVIGFRRITEPSTPGRVRITGWEFIGRKSVLSVDRDGMPFRSSAVHPVGDFMAELTSDAYTGLTNADRRIEHEIVGTDRVFRADQPKHDPAQDTEPGVLIIGNGMTVTVEAAFHDWNGVPGLDMLYVRCHETGRHIHVTPADLGWTEPLRGTQ